jgi:hypothetical protein
MRQRTSAAVPDFPKGGSTNCLIEDDSYLDAPPRRTRICD